VLVGLGTLNSGCCTLGVDGASSALKKMGAGGASVLFFAPCDIGVVNRSSIDKGELWWIN
jgi:hypothetical protein